MKKFLSLIFISLIALSLIGCQSEADKKEAEKIIKEKERSTGKVDTSFLRSTAPNPNEKK